MITKLNCYEKGTRNKRKEIKIMIDNASSTKYKEIKDTINAPSVKKINMVLAYGKMK